MLVKALNIQLGSTHIGILFQYELVPGQPITRFMPDEAFANERNAPTVSLSMKAAEPESQKLLWLDLAAPMFNGRISARNGALLPAFFQGLLPEGVLREHIAALRDCDPKDHFELLAACGRDLPGILYASPAHLDATTLSRLVSPEVVLDEEVVAEPMEDGVSVSGIQPKIGVLREGERYVSRTKLQDAHIIAKLPVVGYPFLPELEHLSLQLADKAGVNVCHTVLEPLRKLAVEHGFDLGEAGQDTLFLAVSRFDRSPGRRIHVEDFGQIMGIAPEDKYTASYLEIAAVMLGEPSLGEAAVHELLRRLTVNELLGNPDMHLKNIGIIYADGRTPSLSPAYDIVGYSAYHRRHGHALHLLPNTAPKMWIRAAKPEQPRQAKPSLSPLLLREFCSALGLLEKPAARVIQKTVQQAVKAWPSMIRQSGLTERQKTNLLQQLAEHPMVGSLVKRDPRLNETLGSGNPLPPNKGNEGGNGE